MPIDAFRQKIKAFTEIIDFSMLIVEQSLASSPQPQLATSYVEAKVILEPVALQI